MHSHSPPLTAVIVGPVKLETLLDEMFPPLKFVGNLLEYNLTAFPVVLRGLAVDMHRTESPETKVVAIPIETYKLEMEIGITRAVRGILKKPKEKEFNYALEITPDTFVSAKQFRVNVNAWVGRKKYSYRIEDDPQRLRNLFDRIHKKVMRDWLRQFETLHQALDLDQSALYQMLFQLFDPEDDAETPD